MTVAVLAAGSGRRFGAPKLLLPAGEGDVLLTRAVKLGLAVAERVLCILPAAAELHRAALRDLADERLTLLANPDADAGMGTSVARAARACLAQGLGSGGLLVLPADLEGVDPAFLVQLIDAYELTPGCDAAAAQDAEGRLMAPALLAPGLFGKVAALQADEGARAILRRAGSRVVAVACPGAEDIDDFASYRRVARRRGWDRETPPEVRFCARRDRALPLDGSWRVGSTLAASVRGHGPGISGFRCEGLASGIERALFAGEGVADRLLLLRAAALLSIADESSGNPPPDLFSPHAG